MTCQDTDATQLIFFCAKLYFCCRFKKHFKFGMHIIGAILVCSSLTDLTKIVASLTVLCNTTCDNQARENFHFLNKIVQAEDHAYEEIMAISGSS